MYFIGNMSLVMLYLVTSYISKLLILMIWDGTGNNDFAVELDQVY